MSYDVRKFYFDENKMCTKETPESIKDMIKRCYIYEHTTEGQAYIDRKILAKLLGLEDNTYPILSAINRHKRNCTSSKERKRFKYSFLENDGYRCGSKEYYNVEDLNYLEKYIPFSKNNISKNGYQKIINVLKCYKNVILNNEQYEQTELINSNKEQIKSKEINKEINEEVNIDNKSDEQISDSGILNIDDNGNIYIKKKSLESSEIKLEDDVLQEIEQISKDSGYSINEIVNNFCKYCIKQYNGTI